MLSSDAFATTPKPRPPASRRPSAQLNRRVSLAPQQAKPLDDPTTLQHQLEGLGNASPRDATEPRPLSSSSHLAPPSEFKRNRSDPTPIVSSPSLELDRDLDLDLPEDLTEALKRTIYQWPQRRSRGASDCLFETDSHGRSTDCHSSYGSLGRKSSLKRSLTPPVIEKATEATYQLPLPKERKGKLRPALGVVFTSPERRSRDSADEKATQNTPDPISSHKCRDSSLEAETTTLFAPEADVEEDASDAKSMISDCSSFNQEWVGNLGRDELEAMLMEANRIIKERERDLGIAAAIGKALLEKNISLRSKHNGIASRLASSTSIFNMGEVEAPMSSFPAQAEDGLNATIKQPCSPPTMDIDITFQAGHLRSNLIDDDTPLASEANNSSGRATDYFGGASASPYRATAAGLRQPLGPVVPGQRTPEGSPVASKVHRRSDSQDLKMYSDMYAISPARLAWVPSVAGLIPSQPASPSESIASSCSRAAGMKAFPSSSSVRGLDGSRARRHTRNRPSMTFVQAAETQRQLASLSEQNDNLLQQLSELQAEAEEAKREGSKKLKRLNKEIGGLQAELESATKRNVELLEKGGHGTGSEDGEGSGRRAEKRAWTTRGGAGPNSPWNASIGNNIYAVLSPPKARKEGTNDSQETQRPSKLTVSQQRLVFDGSSKGDFPLELQSSASTLETVLGYKPGNSEGERALVAQLLAKIKELEETNRTMAEAGSEMDGKLGRAMEDGERLKDAYEAVENSNVGLEGWDVDGEDDSPEIPETGYFGFESAGPLKSAQPAAEVVTPSGSGSSLNFLGSLSASPSNRRAPGNRYIIENRRTIRAALRKERKVLRTEADPSMSRSNTEESLTSYSLDLSHNSSAASSPNSKKLNRKVSGTSIGVGAAARPRIRITPSIEDLGARRRAKEQVIVGDASGKEEWEDLPSPGAYGQSTGVMDSLRPSDALQWIAGQKQKRNASPASDKDNRAEYHAFDPTASPTPAGRMPRRTDSVLRGLSPTSSYDNLESLNHQRANLGPLQSSPSGKAGLTRSDLSLGSIVSRVSSIGDFKAFTDWGQKRTLGSELGSIFGGDDRRDDFPSPSEYGDESGRTLTGAGPGGLESPLRLSDLGALSKTTRDGTLATPLKIKSDRPTASYGRLVPEEEGEDQEDIECVLSQSAHSPAGSTLQLVHFLENRDAAIAATFAPENDGNWMADEEVIGKGGLKDLEQPRGDQFDLIGTAVEHLPVQWADDEDFGKPITESEAKRMGLQLPPISRSMTKPRHKTLGGKSKSTLMLGLAWATGEKLPSEQRTGDGGEPRPTAGLIPRLQIESENQVLERRELAELLRRKRIEALHGRGYPTDWDSDAESLEAEVAARTLAISPARHRLRAEKARATRESALLFGSSSKSNKSKDKGKARAMDDDTADALQSPYESPVKRQGQRLRDDALVSPLTRSSSSSTRNWVRQTSAAAATRPSAHLATSKREAEGQEKPESGLANDFELLDLPGAEAAANGTVSRRVKKQGERGTDYYPISLRARYQPAMVRQRFKVASNEAIVWLTTWISFTTVIIFAFVVAVRRGPAPVLGTSGSTGTSLKSSRRGGGSGTRRGRPASDLRL